MNTTENPILSALTREGVLINVSVRYWRAAKKLMPGDFEVDGELAGETFHAFDILANMESDWRQTPYRERLHTLVCGVKRRSLSIVIGPLASLFITRNRLFFRAKRT